MTRDSEPVFFTISLDSPELSKAYAPDITITLDPNGGTLTNGTITVSYGELVGELPVPKRKSAYKFLGWYTTPYTSSSYYLVTGDMIVATFSDLTLYAQWEYQEHTCDHIATEVIPANCTTGETTHYECKYCDRGYTMISGGPVHIWNEGIVTTTPTCLTNGEKTYQCTLCTETITEVLPADCPGAHFIDHPDVYHWAHEGIDFAVSHRLFAGMSANTFEPDTAMSRAMLVTVLWRYAGEPAEGSAPFTDVPADSWYSQAISWANANGVVKGVSTDTFAPDAKVTREQMVTILYRYSDQNNIDTSSRTNLDSFPDSDKVSSYAKDAVSWAVSEGLIKGNGANLDPQGNATRAQVAAILMRYIVNIVGE